MGDVQAPQLEETVLPVTMDVSSMPPADVETIAPPPPPDLTIAPPPPDVRVEASWLKLAYSFEFLLALMVGIYMWAQVGGQGHMDLLPWYLKLGCTMLLAWCTVKLTAAMIEQTQTWNRRARFWLSAVLLTALLMGGITFYYHLHEVTDEQDTDESSSTSVRNVTPGPNSLWPSRMSHRSKLVHRSNLS